MKQLSTIILSITLALLPLAVWVEHSAFRTWHNRLAIPDLIAEPNRHTPIKTEGTFLPPIIDDDYALTADDNPIILSRQTRIAPEASLTIGPGAMIFAHEFSQLEVAGKLTVAGTKETPVVFTSNEEHPANQTWGGIIATAGSVVDIKGAIIADASPAVSCLAASRTKVTDTEIKRGSMGVFQTGDNCLISRSFINGSRDGIVAVNTKPQLEKTEVVARREKIKIIERE